MCFYIVENRKIKKQSNTESVIYKDTFMVNQQSDSERVIYKYRLFHVESDTRVIWAQRLLDVDFNLMEIG